MSMRCWYGYTSAPRCKWFAYGPTNTIATVPSLASFAPRCTKMCSLKKKFQYFLVHLQNTITVRDTNPFIVAPETPWLSMHSTFNNATSLEQAPLGTSQNKCNQDQCNLQLLFDRSSFKNYTRLSQVTLKENLPVSDCLSHYIYSHQIQTKPPYTNNIDSQLSEHNCAFSNYISLTLSVCSKQVYSLTRHKKVIQWTQTCRSQPACISCNVVCKDNWPHARLSSTTFAHQQNLNSNQQITYHYWQKQHNKSSTAAGMDNCW